MIKITSISDTHVVLSEEKRSYSIALELLNFSPRVGDLVEISYAEDGSIRRVTLKPNQEAPRQDFITDDKNRNLVFFLLLFFLGWIGSLIINYSSLKPNGWKSRTLAHFFFSLLTWGIYSIVVAILALNFDENKASNVGFFRE